jgi:hypothetical protein
MLCTCPCCREACQADPGGREPGRGRLITAAPPIDWRRATFSSETAAGLTKRRGRRPRHRGRGSPQLPVARDEERWPNSSCTLAASSKLSHGRPNGVVDGTGHQRCFPPPNRTPSSALDGLHSRCTPAPPNSLKMLLGHGPSQGRDGGSNPVGAPPSDCYFHLPSSPPLPPAEHRRVAGGRHLDAPTAESPADHPS